MSIRVPAGEMRHVGRIYEHKIESDSTAYDSYGHISASSTAWNMGAMVRAKIEALSGNKAEIARQKYPIASHLVTIDYNSTLASTSGSRRAIVFENRWMFIGAIVDPDFEHRQLELICSEGR